MPSPHIFPLNDENFEAAVTSTDRPIMVAFTSPTCSHCAKMAKHIDSIANQSVGSAIVAKVTVPESPRVTALVGVKSMPTFVFFHKGQEYARYVGDKNPPSYLTSALASKIGK
jgi:thioredoxin-like negative regulator of GroEL